MKLKKVVKSSNDSTIKYIFKNENGFILEYSYINKNDGKNIICVPSQTMCNMGCKFCHTSDYIGKIKAENLSGNDIFKGVDYIYNELKLNKDSKTLLVSYMGCGEPILNIDGVIESMLLIKDNFDNYIRFAVATSIPEFKYVDFFKFVNHVEKLKIDVKLHLSLHYTMDQIRNRWMPKSMNIIESISAVDFFKKKTGNPVEIHYALLDGINDTEQDAILLTNLIKDKDIEPSDKQKLKTFKRYFNKYNIDYIPPGLDIGASCGQFLMEEYLN